MAAPMPAALPSAVTGSVPPSKSAMTATGSTTMPAPTVVFGLVAAMPSSSRVKTATTAMAMMTTPVAATVASLAVAMGSPAVT